MAQGELRWLKIPSRIKPIKILGLKKKDNESKKVK